ncbi:MAG: MlaD family protein [Solirubrobacterales bacterium]
MRRPSAAAALSASPTMVGAVTVLIATVAVFLAYNANSGLPFVPTYNLSAEVPNANTLVPGNEVRIGGVRVGLVEQINPIAHEDGSVTARLELTLDEDAQPIPTDSTIVVRSRSALGLKYLEINRGVAPEGYEEGTIIPVESARPEPVEIDEFLSTFDAPTAEAIRENLVEFGNALAGRGVSLNAAIQRLPEVLPPLEAVMRNLSASDTQLKRFVRTLSALASEVAPVAEDQAQMFVALDTTFAALASVSRPFIQETISEGPPTLDQGTRSFPVIRPFLANTAGLMTDLRPGADALRETSPAIADSLEVGADVLDRAPILNEELAPTARSLREFSEDEGVQDGIARLTETSDILRPTLGFITPAQTTCNYLSLLARNLANVWSAGDGLGTFQRFLVFDPPDGPNNEGIPSDAPSSGGDPGVNPADPRDRNFLHSNPYPNTDAPGQTSECEAGNEGYIAEQQVIGNVPGNQGTTTEEQELPE